MTIARCRAPITKGGTSVEAKLLVRLHLMARAVQAIVFLYHGPVPKILWLRRRAVDGHFVERATMAAPAATMKASSISPLGVWPMAAMARLRPARVR